MNNWWARIYIMNCGHCNIITSLRCCWCSCIFLFFSNIALKMQFIYKFISFGSFIHFSFWAEQFGHSKRSKCSIYEFIWNNKWIVRANFPFVIKWLTTTASAASAAPAAEAQKNVSKFCAMRIHKWYFWVPCWKVVSLQIYAECVLIMLSRTRFDASVENRKKHIMVIYWKIVRVEMYW